MTTPAFDSSTTPVSAASNAALTLALPSGDPTGKLMVAIVASFAIGGTPAAPAGWAGPFGSNGLWIFTKLGVLADSGGNVTFAAWTPEVISRQNSGVVVVYDNVTTIDVLSPIASLTAQFAMTAPQIRTVAAATAVLAIFAGAPSADAAPDGLTRIDATSRVSYSPTNTTHVWLATSDQIRSTAGLTTSRQAAGDASITWRALTVSLRGNLAPNAPGGLAIAPISSGTVNTDGSWVLSWTFSDPDVGDTQSAVDISLTDTTTATTTVTTVLGNTTAAAGLEFGTYTAGHNYQVKVRAYDSHGAVGPYCATVSFTAQNPPANPVITDPTAGQTITVPLYSGPGFTSGSIDHFEVRRVGDLSGAPDTTRVYWDSGAIAFPGGSLAGIPFDVTGRDEHVQLRVEKSGLWSNWVDVLVHVAFTEPPAPTASVATFDQLDGALGPIGDNAMKVTYSTSAPTGGQAAATSVDIYRSRDAGATSIRVATELPIAGEWDFLTPASRREYWFEVIAIADDGATSSSGWFEGFDGGYGLDGFGEGHFGFYEGAA